MATVYVTGDVLTAAVVNEWLQRSGHTLLGDLDANTHKVVGLGTPSADTDASTKDYVDDKTRTRRIVLTASGALAALTNGAEQKIVVGTNHEFVVLAFDKTTDESVFWDLVLPPDYQAGNVTVKLYWYAPTLAAGDVKWNLQTLGRADGEVWDTALGAAETKTDTTEDVAGELNVTAFTAFNPGWAAEDALIVKLIRDANDVADTLDEDAYLLFLTVDWTGQ